MTNVNYVGKGWYEVRFSSDGDELTFKRMSPPDTPPNVSELDFAKIKQREAELLKQIKELREECRSLESSINRMLND